MIPAADGCPYDVWLGCYSSRDESDETAETRRPSGCRNATILPGKATRGLEPQATAKTAARLLAYSPRSIGAAA